MRPLAAQADDLLGVVDGAIVAMRAHAQAPDKAGLATVERALDALLGEYRTLLDEITPKPAPRRGARPKPIDHKYEPFLRCVVSFATLVELIAPRLGSPLANGWGRHVFADSHFEYMVFDKLPPDLPDEAVERIFPDQCADLKSAIDELSHVRRIASHKFRTFAALDQLAIALGLPKSPPHTLGIVLEDDTWLRKQLPHLSDRQITRMVRDRRIISVPTWTGEQRYPTFQIERQHILDSVSHVCDHAAPDFKDWPLAIWMSRNYARPLSFFEERLGEIGLWMPLWDGDDSGQFNRYQSAAGGTGDSYAAPDTLYRVTWRKLTPFCFSAADAAKPHAGGRFDLDATSKKGSLYLGEDPTGAWSEVLFRRCFGKRLCKDRKACV